MTRRVEERTKYCLTLLGYRSYVYSPSNSQIHLCHIFIVYKLFPLTIHVTLLSVLLFVHVTILSVLLFVHVTILSMLLFVHVTILSMLLFVHVIVLLTLPITYSFRI